MEQGQAKAIAAALGGEEWQSGGDVWLVTFAKADGRLVAMSDECVCEYESRKAFDESRPIATIFFGEGLVPLERQPVPLTKNEARYLQACLEVADEADERSADFGTEFSTVHDKLERMK